jgi:hypothetical protein
MSLLPSFLPSFLHVLLSYLDTFPVFLHSCIDTFPSLPSFIIYADPPFLPPVMRFLPFFLTLHPSIRS